MGRCAVLESKFGEELCAYAFGNFRVFAAKDGKELSWRTRRGRELFAYLLDIEGEAVSRNHLIEVLWRDEIPENAVAMLHNMIYNIRRELAGHRLGVVLIHENRKYRLDIHRIACDFRYIKDVAKMVEGKETAGLRDVSHMFETYWGSYLEDIDSLWAEEKRAYYDEIFKRGCWLLAEAFTKEGEVETALRLYENILRLDPYSERAVGRMLSVYGEQRAWKKMKQCYQKFRKLLWEELGITPGEEVCAAYHKYL